MHHGSSDVPRIVIAALRGGSGKTILSIGITAALKQRGLTPAVFKKGPDYIDAGWLALAAGRPCYNLDTFLMPPDEVRRSFSERSRQTDIAIIEGNRGLYDGLDADGTTSTAELAKLLSAPVLLCLDCTKSTRTMAATVLGCLHYDPQVAISGVILNRVAGKRHESILRECIERDCRVPVVGAVPRLSQENFPERHMGLVPSPEHGWAAASIAFAADIASRYIDLTAIRDIAACACSLDCGKVPLPPRTAGNGTRVRVGIIRDSAFQFYYPENIEALIAAGAEPVFLSPLTDRSLPELDALYIGGGFPETHARVLSENLAFRRTIRQLAEEDFPIYAECGGLMYLGESLYLEGKTYPMAGVFPVTYGLSRKPQGHGYTIATVDAPNPFFPVGSHLCGHEFHYSRVLEWRGSDQDMVFSMTRGTGFVNRRDGLSYRNVLASYTHLHALGTPGWADAVVRLAAAYRNKKRDNP